MILGLTGGMGCGKSAAARKIETHGFARMDSDEIIRNEILADPGVIAAIQERFGPEAITPSGRVDRSRLARRVFAAASDLSWLENLLHPRLFARWRAAFDSNRAQSWVVEAPLLFEKSLQNWFDFTICVASHPDIQLARLEQRGIPLTLAKQRISKQLPLPQKIELADFVLWNDGAIGFLHQQVKLLVNHLLKIR